MQQQYIEDLKEFARKQLETFSLFRGINPASINDLRLSSLFKIRGGRKIVQKGGLYIVIDGFLVATRVQNHSSKNKKDKKCTYSELLEPGNFSGECCLINSSNSESDSEKNQPVRYLKGLCRENLVWHVQAADLHIYRRQHSQFNTNLLNLVLIKKDRLEETHTNKNLSATQKILFLLWKLGNMYQVEKDSDVFLPKFFTQELIAILIGVCREQINRAFASSELQEFSISFGNGIHCGIKIPHTFLKQFPKI